MPLALRLLAACLFFLYAHPAPADTITVKSAEIRAEEDHYVLNAEFQFQLTPTLEEALQKGIALYFVLEVEVGRPRWYWFDEKLVTSEATFRISYSALTRQYRMSSGLFHQNLATLEDVVRVLSRVTSRSVARKDDLPRGFRYEAAVRLRLDSAQLPKPFQLSALATRDWQLQSDWYRWILAP